MTTTWRSRSVSPAEVVSRVRSGMTLFLHGAAATPTPLAEALAARTDLENVRIFHLHTNGPAPFADPGQEAHFRSISLFTGAPLRKAVEEGRADFVPIFLSDIPCLFSSGQVKLDMALLQLSPPDGHGLCTLGTSVDAALSASANAEVVVAEVNDQMPRTHGNTVVPLAHVAAYTCTNRPLHQHAATQETEVEAKIGALVAELIPDRACLQLGIGGIPDAVLSRLTHKQDLGVHTEMFSDRIVDLYAAGVITNKYKAVHPGRIVTSFVNGTRRLFDFVNDNPLVEFHPCDRTNDTSVIRKIDNMVAINSAIQVDLTGQVCADSIGHRVYSGIGGQMDFVRGSALSRGGKPILALPATAKGGTVSRIVPELAAGSGVVTTRGHVHWIVTEYGAVNLHGRTLRERAELLISIAHPDFRGELKDWVKQLRHYVM